MASDQVLLIMGIIKDKKNMDGIMYEKLNIGPTLNFNEKLYRQSLNKKFGTQTHKQIYDLQCLEKINSVAFLYMKLLMENLCGGGWKKLYFPKTKGLII